MKTILTIENLKFFYKNNNYIIDSIKNSDFENLNKIVVHKGDLVCLVGENGCGKSSLLNILSGFLMPNSGTVDIFTKNISYLIQVSNLDKNFPLRIIDILSMPLYLRGKKIDIKLLKKILQDVCLQEVDLNSSISILSGGQFQKLLIGRMLLEDADLLLIDEPFNYIDEKSYNDIVNILLQLKQSKKTIILAIHDDNFVKKHASYIMEIKNKSLNFFKNY